jgi:hypothetical protein
MGSVSRGFEVLALSALVLTGSPPGHAHAKCLDYRSPVVLTGTLERRTYPGRPNFEDIRAGDEPETGYYLRLPQPICTVEDPSGPDVNGATQNVRLVQLVLDAPGYEQLRPRIGKQVTVRGRLFAAITAHHHAPLLLTVEPSQR